MSKIFINYRREDSAAHAGRLYDRLESHFGHGAIFMDIDQIEPGEDFYEVIQEKLKSVQVAVVLIGKHWLDITDAAGQRRLDNPDDFVRLEIAALLERGIRVIPVLVGGAAVPQSSQLPECLVPLARRNAYQISDLRFRTDVDKLTQVLEKAIGVQTPPPPPIRPDSPEIPGKPNSQRFMVILGAIAVLLAAFGLFHYSPWTAQENGIQLSQSVVPEPEEWVTKQSAVEQPNETSPSLKKEPIAEQPSVITPPLPKQPVTEQSKITVIEPEMVRIQPGKFLMGSPETEAGRDSGEGPQNEVTILQPFAISRHEITVGQFRQFVQDKAYHQGKEYLTTIEQNGRGCYAWNVGKKTIEQLPERNWKNPGFQQGDDHPVVCVSWNDAQTYVTWLSRRTGAKYHLPTEAEWEYAARGSDGRKFPWGDAMPTAKHLNACGNECVLWGKKHGEKLDAMFAESDPFAATAPVGSFPAGASRWGIEDIVGNVWEWVADYYASYTEADVDDPMGPASGATRVMRGGAWNGGYPDWVRPSFRFHAPPDTRSHGVGFRCAKSL